MNAKKILASIVLDEETEKHFKFKLIKNIFIKKWMNQNLINLMLDLSNFGYEYSPLDIKYLGDSQNPDEIYRF